MDVASAGAITERELAERIRETGLRVTRPRLLILQLLGELGGHRSAEEMIAILRERGSTLPRASVYNVLNDLLARNLVMLADAGPGRALYEITLNWHHHFVCRDCGGVIDVPCLVGSKPCMTPGVEGITVDEAQVIFRGPCPFNTDNSIDIMPPKVCKHTAQAATPLVALAEALP